MDVSKLYVIVRSDLSPAQQAVQAVHAAGYAIRDWPAAAEWPLALLCVSTSHDLRALQDGSFVEFHEPDLPQVLVMFDPKLTTASARF